MLILASIYVLIYFAFAAGLINAIIEGHDYNQAVFLPSRAVQNNYETMIGITLLLFGFVGALIAVKAFNVEKLYEKYALLGFWLFDNDGINDFHVQDNGIKGVKNTECKSAEGFLLFSEYAEN